MEIRWTTVNVTAPLLYQQFTAWVVYTWISIGWCIGKNINSNVKKLIINVFKIDDIWLLVVLKNEVLLPYSLHWHVYIKNIYQQRNKVLWRFVSISHVNCTSLVQKNKTKQPKALSYFFSVVVYFSFVGLNLGVSPHTITARVNLRPVPEFYSSLFIVSSVNISG